MSSDPSSFGRLEKVDLRSGWASESGDFTPWLAQEENITLLGDAIGMELEVEAQEKNVGPFRADILCLDTGTDEWVLVENQLERTDHSHLGQLLTYASGLDAVSIVWIAQRFTDEHRAALDWLNEITNDDFNFFGLEIELWKIGDSLSAPKFNVVSKPNDWTRSISSAAHRLKDEDLTDTRQLQLEYWSALRDILELRGGLVRPTKPLPQYWMTYSIGRSEFLLETYANIRDRRIGVGISLLGNQAKPHFHLLAAQRDELEEQFGEALEWNELPNKKQSRIMLRWRDCDPSDKSTWDAQLEWLYDRLQKFHSVFSQPIKLLDANQFEEREDDEP